MPYILFANSPESLGESRTAYNVSYRRDQTNWVAQVDSVLEGEQELTLEECQAQVIQNQEWEIQNPEVTETPGPEAQGLSLTPEEVKALKELVAKSQVSQQAEALGE